MSGSTAAHNDVLTGDDGADLFVFGVGSGVDTVTNFATGVDVIDISDYGFANFADLSS